MAYAAAADLVARYRKDTVNDLCNDDGIRQSHADLLNNTNLAAALDDASGAVDSALAVGKRYTPAGLAALTGNALAHLKRITCDIAMGYLYERNPIAPEVAEKQRELAAKHLKALQSGEDIFASDADNLTASLPTIDGPSALDYSRINLMPDRTNNFYPSRGGRLPTDRR